MKFVVDVMLGRLAKWLRFLGHDTLYFRGDDDRLLALAREEGRVLLTRDTHLLKRCPTGRVLFIRGDHLSEQLKQVIEELDLPVEGRGSRCMRCNVPLESVEKAEVEHLVPEFVFRTQPLFSRCPSCRRIYWPGSHVRRMEEALRDVVTRSTEKHPPGQLFP